MNKKLLITLIGVLFAAGCAQIGELALKLMTSKEKDLTKMATVGLYQSNLYPEATQTMMVKYSKGWKDGGAVAGVQFIKTEGYGVLELDGTVLINGDTVKTLGGGVYMVNVDTKSTKAVKVDIHSASGQKTSFEIAPAASFKLISVNGKSSDVEVDLTKELVLEFDLSPASKGKLMLVSLISSVPGGDEFNTFQSFYASEKVTIPAGAFKSKQIEGGGLNSKSVIGYKKENQYIRVELVEESRAQLDPVPYFRKKASYFDAMPITLTGEIDSYVTFKAEGKVEVKDEKPFVFEGSATNSFYGNSLESKKLKIGIASLGVYANIFKQTKSTSSYTAGNVEYTTTTITTYEFPKLDDQYWDEYMASIYMDFKKLLESYNVEVVDIDAVMADPNYNLFYDVDNANTKEIFKKKYKNSKRLSIASIFEIGEQTATAGTTDDLPKPKLLKSLGVDAIANLSLTFQVGGEENKVVLYPSMNFMIEGFPLIDKSNVGIWYQGSIYRGKGIPFNSDEFTDAVALNRILQKDMIMATLKKTMDELVAKQREAQVAEVHALMRK